MVAGYGRNVALSGLPVIGVLSLGGALVGMLFVVALLRGELRIERQIGSTIIVLFLFSTLMMQTTRTLVHGTGLAPLRAWGQWGQLGIVFLITYSIARDARAFHYVATVFWLTTVGVAVWALFIMENNPAARAGVDILNLNRQAMYFAVAIVGCVAWLFWVWPKMGRLEVMMVVSVPVILGALLNTGSRGGLLLLAVGVAVAWLLSVRRRGLSRWLVLFPCVAGALTVGFLSSEVMMERWASASPDQDPGMRLSIARAGWDLFKQSPVVGLGTGYALPLGAVTRDVPTSAHNSHLAVLLSFGAVGGVLWVWLWGAAIAAAIRAERSPWRLMVMSLLLAWPIFGVVGNLRNEIVWVVLALAFRLDRVQTLAGMPTEAELR